MEYGDKVIVKRVCHGKEHHPMSYRTCSDKNCEQCQGAGWYLTEVDWNDIVSAIRSEIIR